MANTIDILIRAKDQASSTVKGAGDNVEAAATRIKNASKVAALATAAAAVAIGVDAVKSAGEYESSLSKLRQASGATAKEMELLSGAAKTLGRSNDLAGVSAADAAATMTELAKAGLSVKDTLAAAKGTMSLAKAGNIQFADAAVIAASALNAFNLKGNQATEVADMLAAGANASQAELSDLALGLQQSATVAKQFKLSLDENVTALALFANNGIRGSDAGTSLKTMLIALAKPSKQSADAMREIGFNAYNAEGQFVGLDAMSKRLNKSLKGLTDEQKQNALATIFGTDAFRAAAVLADNAGKSYDSMSKSVRETGAAQKAARANMGEFDRSVEGLKNTLSDVSLRLGTKLLPAMTALVRTIDNSVEPALDTLNDTFRGQIPLLSGAAASIATYTTVVGGITLATKAWEYAQAALHLVLRASPIGVLLAAVTGITTAYALTVAQLDRNKASTDRLKAAQDFLRTSTDAVRLAHEQFGDALLGQETAALAVERAQRNYTDAVRQYGPKSLEAREASNALKRANSDLADQNKRVEQTTRDVIKAEADKQRAKESVVVANRQVEASARGVASGYAAWADNVAKAKAADKKATGNSVAGKNQVNALFGIGKNATGTSYWRGGATLVGENGPELVNLPRGSQVVPNYQTRQMGGGSGDVHIEFNGNVGFNDRTDIDYLAQQIAAIFDKQQRLGARGMA